MLFRILLVSFVAFAGLQASSLVGKNITTMRVGKMFTIVEVGEELTRYQLQPTIGDMPCHILSTSRAVVVCGPAAYKLIQKMNEKDRADLFEYGVPLYWEYDNYSTVWLSKPEGTDAFYVNGSFQGFARKYINTHFTDPLCLKYLEDLAVLLGLEKEHAHIGGSAPSPGLFETASAADSGRDSEGTADTALYDVKRPAELLCKALKVVEAGFPYRKIDYNPYPWGAGEVVRALEEKRKTDPKLDAQMTWFQAHMWPISRLQAYKDLWWEMKHEQEEKQADAHIQALKDRQQAQALAKKAEASGIKVSAGFRLLMDPLD